MAVCDYPHKFYDDIRQCFNSQQAHHLTRLLECDSEVQAILNIRKYASSLIVLLRHIVAEGKIKRNLLF